jgi:hypothetical protein
MPEEARVGRVEQALSELGQERRRPARSGEQGIGGDAQGANPVVVAGEQIVLARLV